MCGRDGGKGEKKYLRKKMRTLEEKMGREGEVEEEEEVKERRNEQKSKWRRWRNGGR